MGTIVVLAILLVIIGLIIRSMYKDKKAGKSLQCGVNCKNCSGHCAHMQSDRK
ncbi:MAG: FeoB-associated Cys-rich membrane protein [Lachnospiraceae bacterium]|nr:FeoB-associated Cys-rich membrane protein [Lachnospiraceae bacterium]